MKNTINTEYNAKEFLLEFFKECNVKNENEILTVNEVPLEFENFIGKKAPYKFVFDIETHNKVKDSELIMQGSYFMLGIRDYLSNKGQASILKINIQPNVNEFNNKLLKKYKILEINAESNNYLYRFSFLSTYQYLNDKKQSNSTIFAKGKEVLDLDLNKFKIIKNNTDNINSLDPLESYETAKSVLNKKVKEDIKPIKLILREKLGKELFRVKDHYFKQIKEKDEEVESCAEKIRLLQSKLKHTSYERDRSILKRLIHEAEERLEILKKKSYRERLKAEENFHINDEIEKHVLSIKNSLINITVFSYPVFSLKVSSNSNNKIIKYDPILNRIL